MIRRLYGENGFKIQYVRLIVSAILPLLFFLSVVRVKSIFPNYNLPFVPLILVLIFLLFIFLLFITKASLKKFKEDKVIITALGIYAFASATSLIINLEYYPTLGDLAFSGVGPILMTLSFPMLIYTFVLVREYMSNQGHKESYSGVFIVLACSLFAIWQALDFETAINVGKYFVAYERHEELTTRYWESALAGNWFNINSFLRVNTDLGAVLGCFSVYLIVLLTQSGEREIGNQLGRGPLIVALIVFVVAGLLSASKGFLLIMIVGGGVALFPYVKRFKITALLGGLSLVLVVNFVVIKDSNVARKYGAVFPYIIKFHNGEDVTAKDFLPVANNSSFQERVALWKRATNEWKQHFWFGLSGGRFKFSEGSTSSVNNTHNLFMQVITDAGLVGLMALMVLVYSLRQCFRSKYLPLYMGLFVSLMVDFFIDHSLPFNILIAWLVAQTAVPSKLEKAEG